MSTPCRNSRRVDMSCRIPGAIRALLSGRGCRRTGRRPACSKPRRLTPRRSAVSFLKLTRRPTTDHAHLMFLRRALRLAADHLESALKRPALAKLEGEPCHRSRPGPLAIEIIPTTAARDEVVWLL